MPIDPHARCSKAAMKRHVNTLPALADRPYGLISSGHERAARPI
ncbi:hypothetical protein RR11_3502 [Ruegeria sp. R11]|nr:hypothetical protein RR11_3502 [Ruegeria sp. R11]